MHGLRHLPDYLQQLMMESLGKNVTQDGTAVTFATGAIIWGSEEPSGECDRRGGWSARTRAPTTAPPAPSWRGGTARVRVQTDALVRAPTCQRGVLMDRVFP
ncbi:MAG: hypothetical protein IPH23_04440 [Gammaproteobacteria bacterium]|nr:hypothetical protein [Gammaproteobacteria bacterium]